MAKEARHLRRAEVGRKRRAETATNLTRFALRWRTTVPTTPANSQGALTRPGHELATPFSAVA